MFFEWNVCFFGVSSFASACLNWGGRILDKLREQMYRYNIGEMLACFGVWSFASVFLNRRDKGKGNMYRHSILMVLFLFVFLGCQCLKQVRKESNTFRASSFSSAFLNWGKQVSTTLQALPLELLFNVFKTCLVYDISSVPFRSVCCYGVAACFLLFDLFVSPMVLLSSGWNHFVSFFFLVILQPPVLSE